MKHTDDNCDAANTFLCPGPRVCAAAAAAEDEVEEEEA